MGTVLKTHYVTYEKPKRFPIGFIRPDKKDTYLSDFETGLLLSGKVAVQEKMDGKPTFFKLDRWVLFAEDLKQRHSIPYKVPARFAVFDIFDVNRRVFLDDEDMRKLVMDLRKTNAYLTALDPSLYTKTITSQDLFPVLLVEKGKISLEELPKLIKRSPYAKDKGYMEGIVVKPLRELFEIEQLRGKLVREEFTTNIKTHYLRKPASFNIIDPKVPIILSYEKEMVK